jgi:hypothetical protein
MCFTNARSRGNRRNRLFLSRNFLDLQYFVPPFTHILIILIYLKKFDRNICEHFLPLFHYEGLVSFFILCDRVSVPCKTAFVSTSSLLFPRLALIFWVYKQITDYFTESFGLFNLNSSSIITHPSVCHMMDPLIQRDKKIPSKWEANVARVQFLALCWTMFVIGWTSGSTGSLLPRIQIFYDVS